MFVRVWRLLAPDERLECGHADHRLLLQLLVHLVQRAHQRRDVHLVALDVLNLGDLHFVGLGVDALPYFIEVFIGYHVLLLLFD